MSQVRIRRSFRVVTATVTTATASCTTLRLEDMAGAVMQLPTITTNAATINVWGNVTDTGIFAQLYDSSGAVAAVTLVPSTNNPTMYALPDASYAVPYVKLVAANTNATAVTTIVMKS